MDEKRFEEKFEEYSAQARRDPQLRERMRAEPRAVLAEWGMPVAPEVEYKLVEDTADVLHVVMPPAPNAALSDDSMEAIAGGVCYGAGTGRYRFCFG